MTLRELFKQRDGTTSIAEAVAPRNDVLIAIIACHAMTQRIKDVRDSWIPEIKGRADYKFFFGRTKDTGRMQYPDEVFLDVDDSYNGLPDKIKAVCKWSLEHGYKHVFKVDDDVLVFPDRLLRSGFRSHDFIGSFRGPSGGYLAGYPSGGPGYWLSEKAMRIVADAKPNGDWAEDRFVGNALAQAGIKCHNDQRYRIPMSGTTILKDTGQDAVISLCCHPPAQIDVLTIHKNRRNGRIVIPPISPRPKKTYKLLIAIKSCNANADRRQACRETWLQALKNVEYKFFIGQPEGKETDAIYLDCGDSYESLPEKTRSLIRHAYDRNFDFVYVCDDDTWTDCGKLLKTDFDQHDYVGFARPDYVHGGAYWLSRKSMEIIVKDRDPFATTREDLYVGKTLTSHGIAKKHDVKYIPVIGRGEPNRRNEFISLHGLSPVAMRAFQLRYIWS